jgi:hypothetical protein
MPTHPLTLLWGGPGCRPEDELYVLQVVAMLLPCGGLPGKWVYLALILSKSFLYWPP